MMNTPETKKLKAEYAAEELQAYETPQLVVHGSVVELTNFLFPGFDDGENGSDFISGQPQ